MSVVRTTLTMAYRKTTAALRGTGRKFESQKDYMRRVSYVDTLHGSWHEDIETPEPIGLAMMPLDQDQDQQGQQGAQSGGASSGSSSQFSQQPSSPAAEIFVHYMNGHIDHPIGYVVDRRTYPYNQKAGDGQIYDPGGNGQCMVFTNDGAHLVSTKNPRYGKNQQQKDRYTSVRYVQKQPQQRDVSKASQAVEAGQQQQQQQQQTAEYKHEGETGTNKVDTEFRVNKNAHQHFSPGDKTVGIHERQSSDDSTPMSGVLRAGGSNVPRWKWDTTDISNGQNYTEITNSAHTHQNQNHYTNGTSNIVQNAGQAMSLAANGSWFGGGQHTHLHGAIIAEPINLGHFNKSALAAVFGSEKPHEQLHLLGDVVEDSGMTMTTSTSAASPPSIPDLGVPYDGFRWIDTTSGIEYSYYGGIWAEGGGAIAFPGSPTVGQVYALGNRQWRWNGIGWEQIKTKAVDVRSVSGAVTVAVDKITTLTMTGPATVTWAGNSGQFGILVLIVGGTGTTYSLTFANGTAVGLGTITSISSGMTVFRVWHDGANIYYSYG